MNQEWQDFLLAQGATSDFEHFGDQAAELDAVRHGTVIVPLVDLALIKATGEENAAFLHNLMTNDVTGIPADGTRYAGFCTPKGRLLASFLIWHEGPDLWLQLAADIQPAIQKKLSMYILRSKAKLHDGSDRVQIGLAGKNAAEALRNLGAEVPAPLKTGRFPGGQVIALAEDRFILALDISVARESWTQLIGIASRAGVNAWRALEIAAGQPRVVAATQEQFIPQMVNFEAVGGVSFKKGCYPGQEIVARTQYLGKIKRRMYRANVAAPAFAGQDLYAPETGDQSCGNVVMAAQVDSNAWECLVVLQSSAYDAVNLGSGAVHLGATDGPMLSFLSLPYEN